MTGNDRESVSSPKADVLNDAKTGEFIEQNKNINTAKKTKTDLKSLYEWHKKENYARKSNRLLIKVIFVKTKEGHVNPQKHTFSFHIDV